MSVAVVVIVVFALWLAFRDRAEVQEHAAQQREEELRDRIFELEDEAAAARGEPFDDGYDEFRS